MRGRPRIPRGTASEILAAINEAAAIPAPSPTPMDAEALREYHAALVTLADAIADHPVGAAHHAWRWRQIEGAVAEMQTDARKMLQRAGVCP